MKKADLLQALSTKFYKVETPNLQQTYGNLKYYLVKVYDVIGEALRDANIAFYVENEGQGNEAAYWSPSEPKPGTPQFLQDLDVYIASLLTDGTFEMLIGKGTVDAVNESSIVTAIVTSGNTLEERRYLIDKDTGGNFQNRQITLST